MYSIGGKVKANILKEFYYAHHLFSTIMEHMLLYSYPTSDIST